MDKNQETPEQTVFARWLKRFGIVGFMFFLIKGLLWLIIFALGVYFAQ